MASSTKTRTNKDAKRIQATTLRELLENKNVSLSGSHSVTLPADSQIRLRNLQKIISKSQLKYVTVFNGLKPATYKEHSQDMPKELSLKYENARKKPVRHKRTSFCLPMIGANEKPEALSSTGVFTKRNNLFNTLPSKNRISVSDGFPGIPREKERYSKKALTLSSG